jgi:hypothetical protein
MEGLCSIEGNMNREKLLQNPLPIDRVAARVTKAAKAEHLWAPQPKPKSDFAESGEVLRTAPLPLGAPRELLALKGQRRGQMVVVGYAADQGIGSGGAKWVVRCDCGRYEHRTRILRWLGTDATDLCRECRHRTHKLRGWWRPAEKATRATVPDNAA